MFFVTIQLSQISDEDWDKAIDAMASRAVFAAKLLSREMPKDIEEAFADAKVSLFPEERDLKTDCSCPDWSNPCKHIAAVYYLLAEQFDENPFRIFNLRGRTKEEIIDELRERRASNAEDDVVMTAQSPAPISNEKVRPLEEPESLEPFWLAGDKLNTIELNPAGPEVENAVLKRLGDAPYFIGKNNMASLLSKAYGIASPAALQKAAGDTDIDMDIGNREDEPESE